METIVAMAPGCSTEIVQAGAEAAVILSLSLTKLDMHLLRPSEPLVLCIWMLGPYRILESARITTASCSSAANCRTRSTLKIGRWKKKGESSGPEQPFSVLLT